MYTHNEIDNYIDFLLSENRKTQRNIKAALEYLRKNDDFAAFIGGNDNEAENCDQAEISLFERPI